MSSPIHHRYNAFSDYIQRIFGEKVYKISIDAGFTCPNRDGSVGAGGCTFCDNKAFNPQYCLPEKSITKQIEEGIAFHSRRNRVAQKYLAYFQSFSNTYAPVELLEEKYGEALRHPAVSGIVIGTRPDCVDEVKLELIASLACKHFVHVEYGIESCYDETLQRIHRGHDFATAEKAICETAAKGIKTGAHLILGLPGETRRQMLDEAAILSKLPLTTVKFHQLQIIKATTMAKDYQSHPENFQLFGMEEYVDFMVDFLEKLHPDFVVERFTSEVPTRYILAPDWNKMRHYQILHLIENRLDERNSCQGIFWNNSI